MHVETLEATHVALEKLGCGGAWERVIALVVQPGVEYGSDFILEYDPKKAVGLAKTSENIRQIYEAHSTDYQSPAALVELVRDHFAILKVGPALTFAYREAIFALAMFEDTLFGEEERSNLFKVIEQVMLDNPEYWQGHYQGSEGEKAFQRKFSLSDRIRYYWRKPQVEQAVAKLIANWAGREIPPSLVSQFLPDTQMEKRTQQETRTAESLIQEKIRSVLDTYYQACI